MHSFFKSAAQVQGASQQVARDIVSESFCSPIFGAGSQTSKREVSRGVRLLREGYHLGI